MKLVIWYSLALILSVNIALSQNQQLDKVLSQLTNDIREYEIDYKAAAVHRGLSYSTGDFTATNLKTAINEYCKDLYDDKAKLKFLFYHFKNDSMSIWLFNSEGWIETLQKFPITADSLLTLENTLKFRVDIENKLSNSRSTGYEYTTRKYRLTRDQANENLTELLLPKPITQKLVGIKYLLILPCLNISSLPYGMLKPWDNSSTLIDSMSYSFVHNLREFFDTASASEIGFKYKLENPIIVGNPSFTDKCTQGLANLPGAEMEAIEVSKYLKVSPYIGQSALKSEIIKQMRSSTFIYLATHGYSDPIDVMQGSFIALTDPNGCGLLTPSEIQNMRLRPTAVVILSACETGNGRVLDAGVIGLARGFLKANAKSVVMSLWKVDDEQTKILMLLFMEELQKDQFFFPAENFRQAVLRYKSEVSVDPIYWASFQNFGTPLRFLTENSLSKYK